MKINGVKILIISCCFSVFSCTKETKENIVIESVNGSTINNEALNEEQVKFWDGISSVDLTYNDIVLPNGYTVQEYNTLLRKTGDLSSQRKRNDLIKDLTTAAYEIINYSSFTNSSDLPYQTRLAYSWGQKYYVNRTPPPGQNSECPKSVYGLDCSGFIWNIFKKANINIINPGWASADALRKPLKIEEAIKKSNRDFENVKVIDLGAIPMNETQSGDIIYWQDNNVAFHIGIILLDKNGNKNVAQSNGSRNIDCDLNYNTNGKKRGPRFTSNLENTILPPKSAGGPAPWGFGSDYGVVRIEETTPCNKQTVSGGLGVTKTQHRLGFENGKVVIEYDMYPIPDQIDVKYRGEIVASSKIAVSGPGQVSFDYNYTNKTDFIEVTITGLISGTAWTYTVNCPQ